MCGCSLWRVASLALALAGVASSAYGQISGADLGFSVRGHVKLSQEKPVLIFKPGVHVAGLKADCKRSDGQDVAIAIGAIKAGQERRIPVPQGKGVYKYQCKLAGKAANVAFKDFELEFDTAVGDVPKIQLTADDVDEAKRQMTVRLSEPAGKIELDVTGDDGKPIDNVTAKFAGEAPGTPLVVKWTQPEGAVMSRFSLRAYDPAGYWNGLEAVTFIDIPHEDVVFESGKWDILPSEEAKLQAPLDRIQTELKRVAGYLQVHLYIGGYTDTVGKPEDNDELSKKRATAIGNWFAKKGINASILAQGFGERVLKVQTPDNTDEVKNRRASYVLGTQPPPANRGFPTRNWHRVK
ncbi:MAG: OmpA family protein [Deltaproteobacteria bacterium]|nr:OmpA family protein [Deltaproteobacteria bacterium]